MPADEARVSTIGSLDPQLGYSFAAETTGWGGGIRYIRLSRYSTTSENATPFVVQQPVEVTDHNGQAARIYPFSARAVTVNGTRIPLEGIRWPLIEPGVYQLSLTDQHDRPILTITRRYSTEKSHDLYDLQCKQTIVNETEDQMLRIVWEQYGQGDIPNDDAVYLGDRRMLVAGYQNLGSVYLVYNRLEEAERCFRQAHALAPDDPGVRYNLGTALRGLGKLPEARSHLEAVVQAQPEAIGAVYELNQLRSGVCDWTTRDWLECRFKYGQKIFN